jgi:hypothetical protein
MDPLWDCRRDSHEIDPRGDRILILTHACRSLVRGYESSRAEATPAAGTGPLVTVEFIQHDRCQNLVEVGASSEDQRTQGVRGYPVPVIPRSQNRGVTRRCYTPLT